MKPISESNIIRRYSQPPGDPPDDPEVTGSISAFPSSPLDMPTATFERDMKRREENHKKLIQWIKQNTVPEVDYGRTHIDDRCRYARAGMPHLCHDFSHFSNLTLWKSGAEKIIHVLGLSAHFPNLHHYELSAVHRQEITQVILKCQLKNLNGKIVGEGAGARHLKQDGWNIHKTIKMAMKCALVDATLNVAGLTGIFVKTNWRTLSKVAGCHGYDEVPRGADCQNYDVPTGLARPVCSPNVMPISQRQKDYIHRISGIKGHTTESLKRLIQEQFNKTLDALNRVEAHQLIQYING